ncbi:PKD domain-containing protein [Sinomonas sp. JGH33]|uniref:PKD domain-containing protein n=1 Tax=Sinomonas terricola TaxID=3110330 RepID=A0ABU5T3Q2_9MICC|nr:PKD domain-containing protein [Sinomonas sp. JGH33]MEA5454106.1 PKD domain-containing protein [Sinomonas sp. JGH33]
MGDAPRHSARMDPISSSADEPSVRVVTRLSRWTSQLLVVCLVAWGGLIAVAGIAQAATTYGIPSFTYSGVSNPPTSDKPQSKLWWNDGSWWADMWAGTGWHIYRLDRGTESWVDTGVVNDSRGNTLADVLWDGSHLFIASHVVTVSTNETPVASISGQPAKLYRYSYSNGTYTLDGGFPATINNNSSESMTIDEDSTGAIWATWTQVSGNSTNGFTNTVYVNYSAPGGGGWATPFVLPVSNPNPSPDDISAVVAFGSNKLGVMWSDQLAGTVWWAWRTDGTNPTASSSWNFQPALKGQTGQAMADDHLDVKQLVADSSGRVFAAVKTSLNDTSTDPTLPQLLLLVFRPGTGAFTSSVISTTGDCVTRPQIVLDTTNNLIHEFQTAPSTSVTGCPFSGVAGSIYEKTASMDNPVFGSGRGTPVIQDGSSANMNDVTTTKQTVNSSTGIVALASDNVAKRYWFADEKIVPPSAAPVASFAATPISGVAPLNVSFTDTSTGSPSSWSWAFGDGGTSTAPSPTYTYTAPGTYTATLTASNAVGSSSASTTITVTATGITTVASTTTYASTAASSVTLTAPSGVAAGDVLVASITVDQNPSVASVPAGWTAMVNGLGINASSTGGARIFTYYYVAGSSEPSSYTWNLSSSVRWGGGITAFRGVNTTTPLDTGVTTAVDTTYSATSITLPSLTTATNGALLIGGVGLDSVVPGVTPPSGWVEPWEAAGGQIAEFADATQVTAGASGTATWTLNTARALGAWRTALRPASPPTAPVASFTASPTSGTVPLNVTFSDTSTGGPTSWSWTFGDGGTSTLQKPAHTYSAAGTYTATLTATNAVGSSSASSTITVNPAPPVASFTASPTWGVAPLNVSFTDTSTGLPTSWSWDFGDGGTSTAQNPTYTYATSGTYTATLAATNATASSSASSTITVLPTPTQPPGQPTLNAPSVVNLANVAGVPISGTAEAASTVSVSASDGAGNSVSGTATAGLTGTWSLPTLNLSSLSDGTVTFTATAANSIGVSPATTATASKDTLAPAAPTLTVPAAVNGATVTSVTVSGTAEAGATVSLTIADVGAVHTVTAGATSDGTGNWSIPGLNLTSLNDGQLTYTAAATDAAGNTGATAKQAGTKKTTALAPQFTNLQSQITSDTVNAVPLAGSSDPGATVALTATDSANHSLSATVIANGSGNWSATLNLTTFNSGAVTFTAQATDVYGNVSTVTTASSRIGPRVVSVTLQNGGTAGSADTNDKVVVVFNEPMSPSSFCSNWTSAAGPWTQSGGSVGVQIGRNSSAPYDALTVSTGCTTSNFGTVSLGANYTTGSGGNLIFKGSGKLPVSSVSLSADAKTLTITLGALKSGTPATGVVAGIPSYQGTASGQSGIATDTSGVPLGSNLSGAGTATRF